jgi:predicted Zn-dependent peptidase
VWACSSPSPFSLFAQQVPVIEKTLSNGMKLLLVERHDDPSIAGGWVAHVGSSNERPGITGIAHLFEHMMFKGTPVIGTTNYQRDLEIIAAQEKLRDQMRAEEAKIRAAYRAGEIDDVMKPENKTARYKELEVEFNKLIAEQRKILVKNEFDKIYRTAGGSGMNAYTSDDMTCYFINVPKNKLELWMWMESERLYRPVFREFYAERDVVFEERRMRTESTPLGKFSRDVQLHLLGIASLQLADGRLAVRHPGHHQGAGRRILRHYYAPQNITLVLVGDFNAEQAAQHGGEIFLPHPARQNQEAPDVVTLEVKQPAEKRMNAEAEDQSAGGHPLAHRAVRAQGFLSARDPVADAFHAHRPALQGTRVDQ